MDHTDKKPVASLYYIITQKYEKYILYHKNNRCSFMDKRAEIARVTQTSGCSPGNNKRKEPVTYERDYF